MPEDSFFFILASVQNYSNDGAFIPETGSMYANVNGDHPELGHSV